MPRLRELAAASQLPGLDRAELAAVRQQVVRPVRSPQLPLIVTHEYLVVRRNGEHWGGPYRNRADALRDYATLRGASLYRRRVIRARNFRLVETKPWDEA